MPPYRPNPSRYESMTYRRCGASGLLLPAISLGLWHNFGAVDSFATARAIACRAFDLGVTHFDLGNNYGPPPGAAGTTFGRLLRRDLAPYRDELIVSTKAGWDMWPGPYGNWGSRKYLLASLDQSLARLGLEYVDIFYHHRPDPDTPLEETMGALADAVRAGKALYAGISACPPEQPARRAVLLLGTRCLIHQPMYSMVHRARGRAARRCESSGSGASGSPWLQASPIAISRSQASRAAKPHGFLKKEQVTDAVRAKVLRLNEIARARGQSLAQMALAWTLRNAAVTSTLIGASRPAHVADAVAALSNATFSSAELAAIDQILEG
jgi:L-glyceraldehyde 3-phosphate reductase